MSLSDFTLLLDSLGGIISKIWTLLSRIVVAGLPLTSWFIGFFLASLLLGVIRREMSVSGIAGSSIAGVSRSVHDRHVVANEKREREAEREYRFSDNARHGG